MAKKFDGIRNTKLGTDKQPASVSVKTKARSKEVAAIFEKQGWKYEINIDPDKPEDISDLELLQHPTETITSEKKVGRNDPCPCGSGKKYKHCHGK